MSQKSTYEDNVISLRDVKIVQKNFTVLSNVNLTIEKGKFNYLIGKTGSGKSRLLADIEWGAQGDTPTKRTILVNGELMDAKSWGLFSKISSCLWIER